MMNTPSEASKLNAFAALTALGFPAATAVQAVAIPAILAGKNIFMEASTGTGKTFAYLAPALEASIQMQARSVILVITPTQELAMQIARQAKKIIPFMVGEENFEVLTVLGGSPLDRQVAALRKNPRLIIGTLGRVLALLSMGAIRASNLSHVIFDEADRLFVSETEADALRIVESLTKSTRTIFASATLPQRIRTKVTALIPDVELVSVDPTTVLQNDIEHWCFFCDGRKRLDFMRRLANALEQLTHVNNVKTKAIIFMSRARSIDESAEILLSYGLDCVVIAAQADKEFKRTSLEKFANGTVPYLLTSDLAARGLDIEGITHSISLDLPEEQTIYIHRAGRTGRAGQKGISIVVCDGVELDRAGKLAQKYKFNFKCKILEAGKILEPTVEEFFERAERAEEQKRESRLKKEHNQARRY